jgi:hypothetical protein
MASSHSDVDLACVTDSPVNLAQWRAAAAHTARLSMDRSSMTHRLMDHVAVAVRSSHPRRGGWVQALQKQITPWLDQQGQGHRGNAYDTVWCTHPSLWDAAARVPAAERICDMVDASDAQYLKTADECSWMTTSDAPAGVVSRSPRDKTLWLPRAVDLSCFSPVEAMDHQPRLMLHADGRHRAGRAMWEWFGRHVWRKVKQAVPEARWDRPAWPGRTCADALRSAWVIVSPQQDPDQGQWSALQAMAMSRPVVASRQAVSRLDVCHGEHLFLSQKPADWVEHCVESLRSAQVRLRLANAGRSFVENHHNLTQLAPVMTAMFKPCYSVMSATPTLALAA